ncbi:histone-lysine N-methyltransferase trithorax [Neocloeon triangulifer]|uniref:histone-lysine N-methyltransferase trithorax n=1 Tax=Neocloeon triangulifer TaxID=2078957 RepID=UPI00286F5F25|nr:histone-lysine N-methyltransferase trithorax [Neocloeon triangulifer]XP_059477074.1 histone-lysine N-methyltransferase trithorax [Neocloeon triangulifer]XP_059477075.1 histone-lysine N-methyltransferase trithorax [Neocloeon triangulifer]XP_059477076.1 histone-lysine N-methyltransferase trithorax [Neocloeon triangulifer]XP_059477079.1 histone-lysine N-methyltransferase trithorax [Neocloeon triangulifer]
MTRYRFPGRTCKNSSTRKRVKGYWSVTEEALEAEQIHKNLLAWQELVGSSDDEDFYGFTHEEEQLARSTAVIEAHTLELEGGGLVGKLGKKSENAKASTSASKQKRPQQSSPSSEPASTPKSIGAKIETESTVIKNPFKSEEKSKKDKLISESTSYFNKNASKSTRLHKDGKRASNLSSPQESSKSCSILKPSTLKFESFSSGHTLGANWMLQSTPTVKPTSLPDAKKCIVCETMTTDVQCDSCRRFVEKMTQKTTQKLMCHRGRAVCKISGVEVKARCPACWLMMCLSKLPIPQKTLTRLKKCLPSSLQYHVGPGNPTKKDPLRGWSDNVLNQTQLAARALMKKATKTANNSKIKETTKHHPVEVEKPKRQKSLVKGPRIKHVCRRACVVLGQPQATFPGVSPFKQASIDIYKKYQTESKHKDKKVLSKTMVEVPQDKAPAPTPSTSGSTLPLEMLGLPAAAPTKAEPPPGWICVDFEATEATGVPVMSAIGTSNLPPALCVLCGSAGKEQLLFCAMCCEPYHFFCLKTNPQLNKMWICERCELCCICNKPTMNDPELVRCQKCVVPSHKGCLTCKPPPGKPWECPACNVCRSCGLAAPNMKAAGNTSFCPPCYKLRLKGNFCPHCQQCYKDDDYDTKMVECAECLSWVHASCEGITDEMYQVLSYLPETVEFHCKNCTTQVPPLWSQAIEEEMRNGIMNIVKNLAKYQSVKLSPNKRVNLEPDEGDTNAAKPLIETKPASKGDVKGEDKTRKEEKLVVEKNKESRELELRKEETKSETIKVKDESELMPKPVELIKQEIDEKDPKIEAAKMKLDFEEGRMPELVVKLTDCVKQKAKATQTLKLKQIREAYNIKECSVHLRKCAHVKIAGTETADSPSKLPSCSRNEPTVTLPTLKTPDKNANYDETPSKMTTSTSEAVASQTIEEKESAEEKKNTSFIELEDETASAPPSTAICDSPGKKSETNMFDSKLLAAILRKASLGLYKSLATFDFEFKLEVLKSKDVEIQSQYLALVTENFPWYKPGSFDLEKSSIDGKVVAKSKPDSAAESKPEPQKNLSQLYTAGFHDNRLCALCRKPADDFGAGAERMLHTGSAPPLDWVHANCALWSSEVWEDRDGYLHCVVPGALSRANRTKCSYCGERGATVGCCQGNSCHNSYHWPCALALAKLGDSIFLDLAEMALYCTDHGEQRRLLAELASEEDEIDLCLDFPLPRRLRVEPARNKKRYADPSCVQIAIGSLRVERLGVISSNLCHDEMRDVLVPHGYVAKRLFWSTKEPWKIVEYVIITELEIESVEESLARDINLTVEHGTHGAPSEVMEKNLRVLRHIQQQEIDLSRDNELGGRDNSDDLLLPPDLKETIFQDLNNELLEGISMHDIFTKLLSDDISKEDVSDSEENPVREVVDYLVDNVCSQESEGKLRKRSRISLVSLDEEFILPKMMKPCSSRQFRLSQLDGADDSSSDSESTESAGKSDEVNVEVETSLTRKRNMSDGDADDGPVKCKSCKRTYRTKASYDKHLSSCTEVSSESSDESSESPTTSRMSAKTSKYGTVVVKTKLVVMQSPDKNQKRKREAKAVRKAVKLAAKPADSTTGPSMMHHHTSQQHHQQPHTFQQMQQPMSTVNDKQGFASAPIYPDTPQIVVGQNPIYVTQPTVYYINVTPSKQNYLLVNGPDGQQNLVCVLSPEQEQSQIIVPQTFGNMMTMPSYNSNTTFLAQTPFLQNMAYSPMMAGNDGTQLVNTPNGIFLSNPSNPFAINQNPLMMPSMGLGHEMKDPSSYLAPTTFTPDLHIKQEPNPPVQIMNPSMLPQKPVDFPPSLTHPLQMAQPPLQPPLISLNQYVAPAAAPPPPPQQPYFQQPMLRPPFVHPQHQNLIPPQPGLMHVGSFKQPVNSTVSNIQKMQLISSSIAPRSNQVKTATRSYVETPAKVPEQLQQAAIPITRSLPPPLVIRERPIKPNKTVPPLVSNLEATASPKVVKITASASVGTQTTSRCSTPSIIKKEPQDVEEKTNVQFKIQSSDGFITTAHNVSQAWQNIFDAVQTARKAYNLTPLPYNPFSLSGQQMTGLGQDPIKYLIEQLPGVAKCTDYTPKFHNSSQKKIKRQPVLQPKLNTTGCARTEPYKQRNPYDMFGWLASEHRKPPSMPLAENEAVNRTKTSSNLPMAMRFRQLKNNARVKVGVFRSLIHGRGLFCIRELEPTEMVIEYAGEVIRSIHTDRREKIYESRGIGCYMFRIDDDTVVDATMKGNAARFINHSCEPNCYSKVVDVLGKKHILIFALRRILPGEELTYDYKFPFEDDKIPCTCGSRKCRKYLN